MIQLYRSKYEYIENFQLYGERHSGTNFLENSLKNIFCLPQTSFFGHKHFMGFAKPERIAYAKHTLFIGVTRNPYDWILAMQELPHHVPKENRKNFLSFIENEWYSVNNTGGEILSDRNFSISQRSPPRYKNIFELRKNKLQFLIHTMPILASNYIFITFESLITNYYNIIDIISKRYHLSIKGNFLDIQPVKKRQFISEKIQNIVTDKIDWTTENYIGYAKR